jgi:hypothetical protein
MQIYMWISNLNECYVISLLIFRTRKKEEKYNSNRVNNTDDMHRVGREGHLTYPTF